VRRTVDDHFIVIADTHRNRRPPANRRLPRSAPHLLSRSRAERRDEPARVLVLIQDDPILIEQWRAGCTVIVADWTEIALPEQLPVEIEREQAAAAERDVDALAVSRWRR
jgi:hypothetical protein